MKHISFPSIEQFRSVIKHVQDNAKHNNELLPILSFTGTVKLHGTNHAVCRAPNNKIYTQSRERITTVELDNAGSSAYTKDNIGLFIELFRIIDSRENVSSEDTIQIFGEWCGGNIQKSVGLNQLPRMFVAFSISISKDFESQVFLSDSLVKEYCTKAHIASVFDFPTYSIDIDFNQPEVAQAKLIKLTEAVEKDCPVARQLLGKDAKTLVGEGVVWTTIYKNRTLRFKVKGEKHSISKVKTLANVDIEKVNSIREFVSNVVTEARLLQGLEHVEAREAKYTGTFLKWVMSDIYKEESDTMSGNGFTSKEVSGPLSTTIRQWFLAY